MEKTLLFRAVKTNGAQMMRGSGEWAKVEWNIYTGGTFTEEWTYESGLDPRFACRDEKKPDSRAAAEECQMDPVEFHRLRYLIQNSFPDCEAHPVMDGTNWKMTSCNPQGEKVHSIYGGVDHEEPLKEIADILDNAMLHARFTQLLQETAGQKIVSASIQRVDDPGKRIELDGQILKWCHTHRPGPTPSGYPEGYFDWRTRRITEKQAEQILAELKKIPLSQLKPDSDASVIYPGARYSTFECRYENGQEVSYMSRFTPPEDFNKLFAVMEKHCEFMPYSDKVIHIVPDPDDKTIDPFDGGKYTVILRDCGSGKIYTASTDAVCPIVIGRSPECSVVLKKDQTVSRIHCTLSMKEGRLMLTDMGSVNGTFLKIAGSWSKISKSTKIGAGTKFRIGKSVMLLEKICVGKAGMRIMYGDICEATCDAIVNASNGLGDMGGKMGLKTKLPGVAESIHYATQGKVEQASKKICREQGVFGYGPGNVFVTSAFDLKCNYIIHAVTMRIPGTFTTMAVVEKLLPKILNQARALGLKSIAIPILGAGTGKLSEKKVLELYHQAFDQVDDLDICVYIYKKGK